MSLHVEWVSTRYLVTDVVPAGAVIGMHSVDPGFVGLVLHYDEAVVVEGPKESVRRALQRALEQLDEVEATDPIPADDQDDQED